MAFISRPRRRELEQHGPPRFRAHREILVDPKDGNIVYACAPESCGAIATSAASTRQQTRQDLEQNPEGQQCFHRLLDDFDEFAGLKTLFAGMWISSQGLDFPLWR